MLPQINALIISDIRMKLSGIYSIDAEMAVKKEDSKYLNGLQIFGVSDMTYMTNMTCMTF